jgi:hypothetical protein
LLFTVFAVAACGGGSPPSDRVYANESQGYALVRPQGWEVSEVRGHTQLAPTWDKAKAKHTIVIRAAAKSAQIFEGKPTTPADLAESTERALRGLPRAKLAAKATLEGTELPGVRYSVSFVPRGLGKTYRREHALIVGSKHVFHVIYTSPANEPVDEASFKTVVATLTEEV